MSDFNTQYNRAVWLDIPVADLERAAAFYRAVLDITVRIESFEDFKFAVLQHDQGNGGCLVPNAAEISRDKGLLVYFNVDGRIRSAVEATSEHGGDVIQDVHSIGPHGFRAIVTDSEGNRIALHSDTDA